MIVSDGRVALRPWTPDDAAFLAESGADPAIRRYNGAHDRQGRPAPPPTLAEAAATIEGFVAAWRVFGVTRIPTGVAFVVVDAVSGEAVGCCGVDDWNGEDVAQVGYWIAAPARGRGFATAALVLLTRWLFGLGAARVFLTVVDGNAGSLAVARRVGFVHEGTMRAHSVWEGERYDVHWLAALPSQDRPVAPR